MKKIGSLFFCTVGLLFPLMASSDSLRVAAYESGFYSHKKADSRWVGIDIEIAKALGKRLQLDVQLRECPFQRCLFNIKEGQYDIISTVFKTSERQTYMRFFSTYDNLPVVFYVRKNEQSLIGKYEDLYKITIGRLRGAFYFERFNNDTNIDAILTNNVEILLKLLVGGRIDAYIGYGKIDSYYIEKLGYQNQIEIANYSVGNYNPLYFGMSKKSVFINRFDEFNMAFQQLLDDGVIEKIKKKYGF